MATSVRRTQSGGMPGRHLLTFELSEEGDELSIHGDPPGLRLLADRLSTLASQAETQSQPGSAQLSTSVWGGNELSLEPQGTDTRLVYQVRIVARPLARKK
jgi:hypothetical protein